MKAFDILDAIRKQFHKHGTGSNPIIFIDAENDQAFEFAGRVDTDASSGATVVFVRPLE